MYYARYIQAKYYEVYGTKYFPSNLSLTFTIFSSDLYTVSFHSSICWSYRYLKSTLGNIQLITKFRHENNLAQTETQLFSFWMEFFLEAIKSEVSPQWYPVSIM